jgi:hypothetical protein
MSLLHVAVTTSALIMSDVMTARAATKFCDIYPERCQYGTNGVYYYYPLGYRMPGSTATPPIGARKNTAKRKKPTATARQEPVTTGRQEPVTTGRKEPATAAREKTAGDGAQSSRPGSNR